MIFALYIKTEKKQNVHEIGMIINDTHRKIK